MIETGIFSGKVLIAFYEEIEAHFHDEVLRLKV